jgi:hypothetical protein
VDRLAVLRGEPGIRLGLLVLGGHLIHGGDQLAGLADGLT